MNLTKKQQQQAVVGVVLVVALGYLYVTQLLTPVRAELTQKKSDLAEVVQRIESLKAVTGQKEELLKRVARLEGELAEVDKKWPRQKDTQGILKIVSRLAEIHGVLYSTFSPLVEQSQTYFQEIPFSMTVSGSLSSVAHFFTALSKEKRIFTIKNVVLNYTPNPKRNQTVTGNFTLYAYVFQG